MGLKPTTELSEKMLQALKLVELGTMTRKEVAAKMGWSEDYFYDLCSGDTAKAGQAADLFKKQLQTIENKKDENIKALVKENSLAVQTLMSRTVKELKAKKRLSHEEKKLLGTYNNSLNNSKPTVAIGNLSYNYVSGLTAEDLMHEFRRLKGIAEASFDRRGVPSAFETGSGSLPAGNESGSGLAQES